MAVPLIPLIAAGVGAAAGAAGSAAGGASGSNTFRASNYMDGKHYNAGDFQYGNTQNEFAEAEKRRLNDMSRAADSRKGVQLDQQAYGLSRDAAMGNAPSQAQNLLRGAQDEALGQNMAMAGAVKGGPGARLAAMRNAQSANAQQQAAGANQMAALRAQEMATARGQFSGMAGQQAQLEAQQRAMNDQRAMGYQGMIQNVDMAQLNAGMARQQLGAQTHAQADAINARINQANADNSKDTWKGVAGALAGGGSGAAGAMGGAAGMGSDVTTKVPTTVAGGPLSGLAGMLSDDQTKVDAAFERGLRLGREQGFPEARDEGEIDVPAPYLGEAEDMGPTRKIRQPTSVEVVRGRHVALGRMADAELAEKRAGYAQSLARGPAVGDRQPEPSGPAPWLTEEMAKRGEDGGIPAAPDGSDERRLQAEDLRRRAREATPQETMPPERRRRAERLASRAPMPYGLVPQLFRIYQDSQADESESERDATTSDEAAKKAAYDRGKAEMLRKVREYGNADPDLLREVSDLGDPAAAVVQTARLRASRASDAARKEAYDAGRTEGHDELAPEFQKSVETGQAAARRAGFEEGAKAADAQIKERARRVVEGIGARGAATQAAAAYQEAPPEQQGRAKAFLSRAADQLWMANPTMALARPGVRSDYTTKTGKLPEVPVDDMADAMRKMRPTSYAYKDEFRPGHQEPGEVNVGPVANDMAEDDVSGTAIFRDSKTGKLAIDKEKGLKLSLGGLSALQAQIDDLKKSVRGKGRGKRRGR